MQDNCTSFDSSKRLVRPRWLAILFAISFLQTLSAQQPKPAAYTDAEKSFAAEIIAQPLEGALKTIGTADTSRITEGLYTAMHDAGNQTYVRDAHQSIIIFEEAEAVATRAGLPIQAAEARSLRASGLVADGEPTEAIAAYDQALAMLEAAHAPPKRIASLYLSRSSAREHLGDIDGDIADANEALRINQQLGDEVGLARVQNALGNAFASQGDFNAAQIAFEEALRLARAHGEKLGEAFILNNLSMVYSRQGDLAAAVRFCEDSLKIKRAAGNKLDFATSLINLANYYHLANREKDANRVLLEAAQIGRDTNRKLITSKALAEMGIFELDDHNPEAALKLLLQADDGSEDLLGHIANLNKTAEAHSALHRYDLALKASSEASDLARNAGMVDQLSTGAFYKGQANMALGRISDARRAYQESISAVEQLRGNIAGGTRERQMFLSQRTDPYRMLAALDAREGDWAAALDNSEKAKGRVLLDVYAGDRTTGGSLLTPAERGEETRLQGRILSLDARHSHAPTPTTGQLTADANLTIARADLDTFRQKLYIDHPELRLRRAEFGALTPAEMQSLVPDRTSALLEYELTPRGNFVFVITRGPRNTAAIQGYKLRVSQAQLAVHVRLYHDQLASRDPGFATESRWLYAGLLQPAHLALKGKTSITIVPDGVLWHVPFQSLLQPDGTYFVESAAINYIPSLAVLQALKSTPAPHHQSRTLLAIGNPSGDAPDQASETQALETLYGRGRSKLLSGKAATLAQFRLSSASYDVVHVAAHGIFDDHDPMSSHMLLASATSRPRDGWLQARDLEDMKLHADLVVLSGCETGQGAFEDGEGLVGMSWAALAAGARGTIASAWRVEAQSTTEMMLSFHTDMLHGTRKSEALRRAEIKLIHNDKFRHPFYWAAFDLMGDGA